MTGVNDSQCLSSLNLHDISSDAPRLETASSAPHPASTLLTETLLAQGMKNSLHQFMINSSRKSPYLPVNKITNHRNHWEFATNFAEFLDESSPKNPVGLRGGEPLHQGSCVRQLRSQGVQGQGAEVAFFSNRIGLWRFQFKATNHIHQSL